MAQEFQIYVLNLERHPERLINMSKQLDSQGLTWERSVALDALAASNAELEEYTDAVGPIPRMGVGARACTVGHFRIWRRFLESKASVAFILEDDARLTKNFSSFVEIASSYRDDVDILNFNRQNSKGDKKKLVVSRGLSFNNDMFQAQRLLGPHYGTAGYMITRKAAKRLVHEIGRTNLPIDCLLFSPNVSKVSREFQVCQVFPAMVEPNVEAFTTSIQNEVIPKSMSLFHKIKRAYYEINRVPLLLIQVLLRRAEIKVLNFTC